MIPIVLINEILFFIDRNNLSGKGLGLVDEVVRVSDSDAIATAKLLARREGIFAGISSDGLFRGNSIPLQQQNSSLRLI